MNIKNLLRQENAKIERDFNQEEARADYTGQFSPCANCGEECNPANVSGNGKKYCAICWELSEC